jgi:hypothetical protein
MVPLLLTLVASLVLPVLLIEIVVAHIGPFHILLNFVLEQLSALALIQR